MSVENFINPSTHIYYLSSEQGIVPDELKIAKLMPLFKSMVTKQLRAPSGLTAACLLVNVIKVNVA